MRIDVTQEDIDKGQQSACYFCPIARAMNRASRDGTTWAVFPASCRADSTDRVGERRLVLPPAAREFIRAFDAREPVSPFSFDLDIPPAVAK